MDNESAGAQSIDETSLSCEVRSSVDAEDDACGIDELSVDDTDVEAEDGEEHELVLRPEGTTTLLERAPEGKLEAALKPELDTKSCATSAACIKELSPNGVESYCIGREANA